MSRSDALPREDERLSTPIRLPHCPMPIVEWRGTAALPAETALTRRALEVVDETCQRAFESYGEFLRVKRLPQLRSGSELVPEMSLLPANVNLDGKAPRALNDMASRFEAVAPGCCYWGLYVESIHHLFVRNDPLVRRDTGALEGNPYFIRTLTHEISHVLSARFGVWSIVGYDRARDEKLAEEFVAFMGIAFPVESSVDNLRLHHAE